MKGKSLNTPPPYVDLFLEISKSFLILLLDEYQECLDPTKAFNEDELKSYSCCRNLDDGQTDIHPHN